MHDPILIFNAEPTRVFDGTPDTSRDAYDQHLCKQIMSVLHRHYPCHDWMVEVDSLAGISKVRIGGFSETHPWLIHLSDLASDPSMRWIIRAGGDYLERLGLSRAGFNKADLAAAMRKWGGPLNRKVAPGATKKTAPAKKIDWAKVVERALADKAAGRPVPDRHSGVS
jgi:hypothetical protein